MSDTQINDSKDTSLCCASGIEAVLYNPLSLPEDSEGGDSLDPQQRRAVLTKSVKAGDIIFSNAPFNSCQLNSDLKRERCSYCFCRADESNGKLRHCSRCESNCYCSIECQKADYTSTGHKVECKRIEKCKKYGFYGAELDKVLLLIKTAKALLDEKEDHGHEPACKSSQDGLVHCGLEHCGSLSFSGKLTGPNTPNFQAANRAVQVVSSVLFGKNKEEMTHNRVFLDMLYHMFDQNNFAITDDLCHPLGTGIYPHAAILNHSCTPNAIMRFKLQRGHAPVVECVALFDCSAGVELVHAYCDLTHSLRTRQDHLKHNYDFTCKCLRCSASSASTTAMKMNDRKEMENLALSPIALRSHLDGICNTSGRSTVFALAEKLTSNAEMSDKDTLQGLNEESSIVAWCDRWTSLKTKLRPFDESLYNVATKVFSELVYRCIAVGTPSDMTSESVKVLLECASLITSFITLTTYGATPAFPMLGLHLFTFGDVCRKLRDEYKSSVSVPDALLLYQWAREILFVTHGPTSEYVNMLDDYLKELSDSEHDTVEAEKKMRDEFKIVADDVELSPPSETTTTTNPSLESVATTADYKEEEDESVLSSPEIPVEEASSVDQVAFVTSNPQINVTEDHASIDESSKGGNYLMLAAVAALVGIGVASFLSRRK
jgi:hypothetical protein